VSLTNTMAKLNERLYAHLELCAIAVLAARNAVADGIALRVVRAVNTIADVSVDALKSRFHLANLVRWMSAIVAVLENDRAELLHSQGEDNSSTLCAFAVLPIHLAKDAFIGGKCLACIPLATATRLVPAIEFTRAGRCEISASTLTLPKVTSIFGVPHSADNGQATEYLFRQIRPARLSCAVADASMILSVVLSLARSAIGIQCSMLFGYYAKIRVRFLLAAPTASFHFCRSLYSSTMRRTNSATEIPSRAASCLRKSLWGTVNEIICFCLFIPKVYHTGLVESRRLVWA